MNLRFRIFGCAVVRDMDLAWNYIELLRGRLILWGPPGSRPIYVVRII